MAALLSIENQVTAIQISQQAPLLIDHIDISAAFHGRRPKRPHPRACNTAPLNPDDRRTNKDELTVGNFNAEWLYINGGSGSVICPGRGCPWKNKNMALKHFSRIAHTIASLDFPDILHLTEVEGCDALDKLIQILETDFGSRKGEYKAYLVPGRDTALGQQVGLITKVDPIMDVFRTDDRAIFPIKGSLCGWTKPGEPSRLYGSSKNYFARFQVNGVRFLLSGNHFIAYPDKRDRCEKVGCIGLYFSGRSITVWHF